MVLPRCIFALVLSFASAVGGAARADDVIGRNLSEIVSADVVPGWRETTGSRIAGLAIDLAPGWHTYWRSAGAGGIPPQFDWSASDNVLAVTPVWPSPKVLDTNGKLSIGFDAAFVLPLRIEAANPARPVSLRGSMDLAICKDVCLPARLSIRADLVGPGQDTPAIREALARAPFRGTSPVTCNLALRGSAAELTASFDMPPLGGQEVVIFEVSRPDLWVSDARVRRRADRVTAVSELLVGDDATPPADASMIRITAIGTDGAVEMPRCGP